MAKAHWRTLKSGKRVWVRASSGGKKSLSVKHSPGRNRGFSRMVKARGEKYHLEVKPLPKKRNWGSPDDKWGVWVDGHLMDTHPTFGAAEKASKHGW